MGNMKETDFPVYTVNKPIEEIRFFLRDLKQLEKHLGSHADKIRILDESTVEIHDDTMGKVQAKLYEITENDYSLQPDFSKFMPNHALTLKIHLSMNPDDVKKTDIDLSLEHDLPFFMVPLLKTTLKETFQKFFSSL
jgi:hypothetical protein